MSDPAALEHGDLAHDGEPLDRPSATGIRVQVFDWSGTVPVLDGDAGVLAGKGRIPIPAGGYLEVFEDGEGD